MPVNAGDKFALIVIPDCKRMALATPIQLTAEWSAEPGPVVTLDEQSMQWLGESRWGHINDRSLTFLARRESASAFTYDQESQELERAAQSLLYAHLLGGVPNYQPEGLALTGGVLPNGRTQLNQLQPLQTFHRHPAPATTATIDTTYINRGAARVQGLIDTFAGTDALRFRRGFNAWRRGIVEHTAPRRLHQFVRSLDGVLKLETGKSRKQFIARCQRFCTSSDPDLVLNELYELRSVEEHLNDWGAYFGSLSLADGEVRYAARAWQAECLADAIYGRLFEDAALRTHFADDASTDAFWLQTAAVQQAAWNLTVNLDAAAKQTGYVGP